MTRSTTLFALATATLLGANLLAQPVTQYLKIVVTENSNLTVQQPTSMVLSFSSDGTNNLDSYDMGNQSSLGSLSEMVYPFTLTDDNYIITSMDASAELTSYRKIRFGFATKFPSSIKIIASAFGNTTDKTNQPTYAWIEQISTGYAYPILGDTVKIDIPANLNFESDFFLHTGPVITNVVTDETCFNSYNGSIATNNPNLYNWNLSVYNNSTLVFTTPVYQPDTIIGNLNSGTYTVVTSINSMPVDSVVLFVNGSPEIIADFITDNNYPTTSDLVTFTNASSGALLYTWDFGDGNSDSTANASHQYAVAGNYQVLLTATNANGCSTTTFDSVFVTSSILQFHQAPNFFNEFIADNSTIVITEEFVFDPSVESQPSTLRIVINQREPVVISVRVLDNAGRTISAVTSSDSSIELSVPQAGIYYVQMISSNGEAKSKTVFVNN